LAAEAGLSLHFHARDTAGSTGTSTGKMVEAGDGSQPPTWKFTQ
jgi:hypothetical protein